MRSLVLLLFVSACGPRYMPTSSDPELARGRKLLLSHCGNCHQPPSPADRAAAEWPAQVAEMRERAGLTPDDAMLVERYLAAFASDQPRAR